MLRQEFDIPFGNIQFATGSSPGLTIGTYTIGVTHTIYGPSGDDIVIPGPQQTISVEGPQFTLDPQLVSSSFPPDNGADVYDSQLPFVAFSDPDLPWDINIDAPGAWTPPLPWMALLIFAEGEILLDPSTNSPLTTMTIDEFINGLGAASPMPPQFTPRDSPPSGVQPATCQVITIPADVFETVLPSLADLQFLAHRRTVNVAGEPAQTVSSLICNRLPYAAGNSPESHVRYYAHVVSLQGFAGSIGAPVPPQYAYVQLVSLYNWTFLSMAQPGASFETLVQPLAANAAALALPIEGSPSGIPPSVVERIQSGYVALDFHAFDSETYAWYRGPLSAVPASPSLDPGVTEAVENATTSDALLIYLSDQGLFDTGYAAAWNLGRNLALANGNYQSALLSYRQQGSGALALLAQRMGMPHFAGLPPRALLARRLTRRRLVSLVKEGLGRTWDEALAGAPAAIHARSMMWRRGAYPRHDVHELLARQDVVDAIADSLTTAMTTIAQFLGSLCLLEGMPFSALVPDPRMFPIESARFFHLDTDWIAALVSGAASLGLHTSVDVALHLALWPHLRNAIETARRRRFFSEAPVTTPTASPGWAATGMLLRSELVSSFPTVNITAQNEYGPLSVIRDVTLSPSVRLCLFDGVPSLVTIAEPYHGLRFGFENGAVRLRAMSYGDLGALTDTTVPLSSPALVSWNGCVNMSGLALAIQDASPGETVDPGVLAMQLVQAPQSKNFVYSGGEG